MMKPLNRGATTRRILQRPLVAIAMLALGLSGVAAGMTEEECLAVLESDAGRKEKTDACRELVRVGGADAVPVLASLLGNNHLAHVARNALESIPDPSVDVALRRALDQVDGPLRVGVIGSIGVRRDTAATDALVRLLDRPDDEVSQAAARALGKLGTVEAAAGLIDAWSHGGDAHRQAVAEGLLRCAEILTVEDGREHAIAIYDRLRTSEDASLPVRVAGLRGAALARKDAGLPLVLEALNSEEFVMVAAAARVAQELEGPSVTQALVDLLALLPSDAQVVLAATLGLRDDPAAIPGLLELAREGRSPARLAALRAVAEIGDPSSMPALLVLQSDPDSAVAAASQAALAVLQGPEIDENLVRLLGEGNLLVQRTVIDLVGHRRIRSAVPQLLALAGGADASLRTPAIDVLGDLAEAKDLPAMIDVLLHAPAGPELKAAEGALSDLCVRLSRPDPANVTIRKAIYGDLPSGPSRDVTTELAGLVKAGTYSVKASNGNFGEPAPGIPKTLMVEYAVHGAVRTETVAENQVIEILAGQAPPDVSDALCAALTRASGEPELACLRLLRLAGGTHALAEVRGAVDDADPNVRRTAASVLAGWSTVDAVPVLLEVADSTPDRRARIIALRGAYRLIPLQTVPAARKLSQVEEALALSDRPDEQRIALSTLAGVALPESLVLVMPYLEDPVLAEEAGLAAVAVVEKLVANSPVEAADAARRVLDVVRNPETRTRAQAVLTQAGRRGAK